MSLLALLGLPTTPVDAANSDHSVPTIWINAGGGNETNGSDGLRMLFNSNGSQVGASQPGQDQIWSRNTSQFCCSASAPMLNIGGTLYGEAGAASDEGADSWTDLVLVGTTGSATDTAPNGSSTTGNGTAHFRYTATHGGRDYVVDRRISYVYPNTYFTDDYDITIPAGNTDTVKFYLGGDTAPGSDDTGVGVMLTSPRRTVYSVNPNSNIQIGFGEAPGTVAFDGAVSGPYSAPYGTVDAGGDIGFSVDTNTHDAGIMIQWTLGTTPGTYDRTLSQFATARGVSLSASFSAATANLSQEVDLDLDLANTTDNLVSGLDFTFTLPSGLVIGNGGTSNSCGGTLSATAGGTTIELAGGSASAADNCVVSVPVESAVDGIYTIGAGSVSGLANLNNSVGTTSLTVGTPPMAPAVTGLAPTSGPEAGGTTVTITGTDLTGATAVDFGAVAATNFTVDSATQITATSPAGTGTVDVTVTTPGGTSTVSGSTEFTYLAPTPAPSGACPADHGWNVLVDQTSRLYQSALGRSADTDGLTYWTRIRLNGLSALALTDNLLASSERMTNSGSQSHTQFVEQLYQDVLGRSSDTDGLAYWVGQLSAGMGRPVLVLLFSDSAENVALTGTRSPLSDHQSQVCRLYETVFHRTPDDGGYAYWADMLSGGLTSQQVVTRMLATPEGQTVAAKSDDDFVDHVYMGALDRHADSGGLTYWKGLAAVHGRPAIVVWLANYLEVITIT